MEITVLALTMTAIVIGILGIRLWFRHQTAIAAEAARMKAVLANPHLNLKDALRRIPDYGTRPGWGSPTLHEAIDRLAPEMAQSLADWFRKADLPRIAYHCSSDLLINVPPLLAQLTPFQQVAAYATACGRINRDQYFALRSALMRLDNPAALTSVLDALRKLREEELLCVSGTIFMMTVRDALQPFNVAVPYPIPTWEEWKEQVNARAEALRLDEARRELTNAVIESWVAAKGGGRHRPSFGRATADYAADMALLPLKAAGYATRRTGRFLGDTADTIGNIFDP